MSKLFFKNNVGKIYEDKIVVYNNKIPFNSIKDVDLVKTRDKTINKIFAAISAIILLLSLLFHQSFFKYFAAVSLVFLSLSVFFVHSKYFMQVFLNNYDNLKIIRVKKQNKEEAKVIIKKIVDIKNNNK